MPIGPGWEHAYGRSRKHPLSSLHLGWLWVCADALCVWPDQWSGMPRSAVQFVPLLLASRCVERALRLSPPPTNRIATIVPTLASIANRLEKRGGERGELRPFAR